MKKYSIMIIVVILTVLPGSAVGFCRIETTTPMGRRCHRTRRRHPGRRHNKQQLCQAFKCGALHTGP